MPRRVGTGPAKKPAAAAPVAPADITAADALPDTIESPDSVTTEDPFAADAPVEDAPTPVADPAPLPVADPVPEARAPRPAAGAIPETTHPIHGTPSASPVFPGGANVRVRTSAECWVDIRANDALNAGEGTRFTAGADMIARVPPGHRVVWIGTNRGLVTLGG